MNWDYFFETVLVFFFVLDPLGNIPIFIGALKHIEPPRQREIILREMVIALGIMLVFFFFGHAILHLLSVDAASLNISGGIILFLIAIKMVFSTPSKGQEKSLHKEPLIVPLAIPAIAGPGILATISLYAAKQDAKLEVLIALVLSWLISVPFLLACSFLRKLLKANGLIAVERLMGFIVILIAVDMCLKGVIQAI